MTRYTSATDQDRQEMLERINLLRRSMLQVKKADEAMEQLINKLGKAKSNAEFLEVVGKFVK